jgi:hypothetical protein
MVSKRSLPPAKRVNGNGAAAVVPKLQEGDRVHRLGGNPRGIVREVKKSTALVWWGTADSREVLTWVPAIELERSTETTHSPDEVIQRQACGGG